MCVLVDRPENAILRACNFVYVGPPVIEMPGIMARLDAFLERLDWGRALWGGSWAGSRAECNAYVASMERPWIAVKIDRIGQFPFEYLSPRMPAGQVWEQIDAQLGRYDCRVPHTELNLDVTIRGRGADVSVLLLHQRSQGLNFGVRIRIATTSRVALRLQDLRAKCRGPE